MCGRFTLTTPLAAVPLRFGIRSCLEEGGHVPRYNILIPSWAKDPAIGNRMINARAEIVTTRPAFRVALRKRRCLVVADGFHEWQERAWEVAA